MTIMQRLGITAVPLLLALVTAPAAAGDLFRRNVPGGAGDNETITVTWFEKANGIVAESVCRDLAGDRQRYPVCRQRAKELFERECRLHTERDRKSEMPVPELRAAKKKFCAAAATFVP